ncbi:MAG: type II secretion system F family protein [Pseudomonas sp.]|nr:type II secretion system F family protein [Pseudomonas sp.]
MAVKTPKTQTYKWEGKNRQGVIMSGEMPGHNVAFIKAKLRQQGINPTKVRKKGIELFGAGKKIKPMDIAVFSRQMATMMKAGVPLLQSFDIITEGVDNPNMRKLMDTVKNDVSSGSSLAIALRKHPLYFDELYCNLVDAGEQSGSLEGMLDRVATYKEKTEALKSKIKKAMNYPIAVLAIALIVTAILLIKVVPQFQDVFANFGAELPAFTLMVIALSEFVQSKGWMILVAGVAAFFLFRRFHRSSQAFRDRVDRILLKMPVVGDIIYKAAVARFSRTLATTFAAGVPVVDALDSVAGATGNIVFKKAVMQVKEDVTGGMQLNFAMRNTGVFPSMVLQMTSIGEESGAIDNMLDKVATHYESEVDNAVDGLTALLEPIIMSVLGVLIGGLMIAMYLPIFQLGAVV